MDKKKEKKKILTSVLKVKFNEKELNIDDDDDYNDDDGNRDKKVEEEVEAKSLLKNYWQQGPERKRRETELHDGGPAANYHVSQALGFHRSMQCGHH